MRYQISSNGCNGKGLGPENQKGTVTVNSNTYSFLMEGSGATCLILGSCRYYPRTFSSELKRHFRMIYVDLRHFSPAVRCDNPSRINLDTYLSDIDGIRKAFGIERSMLMGHSIHGTIALEYARRFPDNVSRVVSISAVPMDFETLIFEAEEFWEKDASRGRKHILQRNWEEFNFSVSDPPSPNEVMISGYILNGPKYWYNPSYRDEWLWEGVEFNIDVSTHLWSGILRDYDFSRDPIPVFPPVFMALGRHDYIVPYFTWSQRKERFIDLSFHLFENSGHSPQLEEAWLFDQKLLAWFYGPGQPAL